MRAFGEHSCETRWELTDYGALGASSDAQDQVTRDMLEFVHDSAPFIGTLMKSATDIRTLT